MILYYTGTGNSEFVAKRIAVHTQDICMNLFERLRNHDYSEIHSTKPFVIVCPTYGWQIPHFLRDWLKEVHFCGCQDIYFVLTCGGNIGNAEEYLMKLCKYKNMNFKGCAEIVMPENYIALFDAPNEDEARAIVEKAIDKIDSVSELIHNEVIMINSNAGMLDKLRSGVVNKLFYSVFVHAKKFRVDDSCIGCEKCVKACVMNNIRLVDGKPVWSDQCTHCMACICGCPTKAIEYGKSSVNKPRYQCPKYEEK